MTTKNQKVSIELTQKHKEPQPLCHALYHDKLGDGVHKDTCPECGYKKEKDAPSPSEESDEEERDHQTD
jgi:ribosomal protein L37AE/L43A